MKDSILCCAFCLGLGVVVGGVIVSKNSKIRNFVNNASNEATEAAKKAKETIEEKLDQSGLTSKSN